ncbi:MAG TPA: BNR repeat-containing protein, partial [Polyangiaceae bacterium]|nr:BNR repeat-containing protein [Polyangiaceae bacterium]
MSYGGYLNGESFQQEGIITHLGYQYAAFWNSARHVVLARRQLPSGAWSNIELTDYTNSESDAHNTISLGVSAADGVLHVAFDHHSSPLHYRHSTAGLASEPATATWAASSFGAVSSSLVSGVSVSDLTYPRFISEPGGAKMLFSARLGTSGSGDEYLWEYDAATHGWASLGKYLDGITDNVNAYPHGLSYGPGSKRLHIAWCWRDTSNASTNHDLLYLYSDDNGRTWHDNAADSVATTGSKAARVSTSGLSVWKIGQNRGLINQEHMVVDAQGRVHVLLSHLADAQADDSNFDSARGKSQYFHYFRDAAGKWSRTSLGEPAVLAFRGKLALSASSNLYAILPDLRIAAASPGSSFAT